MKLILFLAAILLAGCDSGIEPTPIPTNQATCNVTINGQNVTVTGPICGSGSVTVTQPSPTPAPSPSGSPGAASCIKRADHVYEGNVMNAWRSIAVPEKGVAGHVAAMVAALRAMQFEATSGGLLSPDEVAVKVKGGTFSETYDVWLGDLALESKQQVLYVATCTPASF